MINSLSWFRLRRISNLARINYLRKTLSFILARKTERTLTLVIKRRKKILARSLKNKNEFFLIN